MKTEPMGRVPTEATIENLEDLASNSSLLPHRRIFSEKSGSSR